MTNAVKYTDKGSITITVDYRHRQKSEYKESFKAPKAKILAVDDVNINLQVITIVRLELLTDNGKIFILL